MLEAWDSGDRVEARLQAEALIVDVDGFEGPLDLLLTLAREQKVDLTQISIVRLAEQYLDFVAAVRTLDRLLVSGFYVVPLYYLPDTWLAHARDVVMAGRQPAYFLSNETLARLPAPAPAN